MSFLNNFLTAPLYAIVEEFDDDYEPIGGTDYIAEVWGVFEDGTILVKDEKPNPVCLRFVRPLCSDPILFFSRQDAEQVFANSTKIAE